MTYGQTDEIYSERQSEWNMDWQSSIEEGRMLVIRDNLLRIMISNTPDGSDRKR